jgi:hypothetical protein
MLYEALGETFKFCVRTLASRFDGAGCRSAHAVRNIDAENRNENVRGNGKSN